jgi:hypothetical protein
MCSVVEYYICQERTPVFGVDALVLSTGNQSRLCEPMLGFSPIPQPTNVARRNPMNIIPVKNTAPLAPPHTPSDL